MERKEEVRFHPKDIKNFLLLRSLKNQRLHQIPIVMTVDQVLNLKLRNASHMMSKEGLIIEVTNKEEEKYSSWGMDPMKTIHKGEARYKRKVSDLMMTSLGLRRTFTISTQELTVAT